MLRRLAPDATLPAVIDAIEADGAVIVDRLFDTEDIDLLRRQLDPFLEAAPYGNNSFSGFRTRRIGAIIARAPASHALALHPLVTSACAQYLRRFTDGIQLHLTQAVAIGPGESGQLLHRDRGSWPHLNRRIETELSAIWAVTDFTADNGATRVVPGSHRWDRDRAPLAGEAWPAEMPAGSVLLHSGSLFHGGGPNSSGAARIGLLLHYNLNWLRQAENQYLSCPVERAERLTPEMRALIGYAPGGAYLGFHSTPDRGGREHEMLFPEALFGKG